MKMAPGIFAVIALLMFAVGGAATAQTTTLSEESAQQLVSEINRLSQTMETLRAELAALKSANEQMASQLQASGLYSHSGTGRRIVTSQEFHELGAKTQCTSAAECDASANGVCVDLGFGGASKVNSRVVASPIADESQPTDAIVVVTSVICS